MKSFIKIFVFISAIIAMQMSAQSLKDMKRMLKESMNTKPDTAGLKKITVAQGSSQYMRADAFLNSGKRFYKTYIYVASAKFVANVKDEVETSEEFFKNSVRNDKGELTGFGELKVNDDNFPMYYIGGRDVIYFIDNYALVYDHYWASLSAFEEAYNSKSNGLKVMVYHADKSMVKGITMEKVKELITNYFNETASGLKAAKESVKLAAEKAEADKRAKFTTKGKDVVKLKLKCASATCVQGQSYVLEVIAVLKNGTEVSTATGGFPDEYDITATGLPTTYNSEFGQASTIQGCLFVVPQDAVVKGDKITITVKSKYYPSQTANITFNMDYSGFVKCDYNAYINSASSSRRTRGSDLRVEIKAVKNAVSGADLLEYKVFAAESGRLLRHFRVDLAAGVSVETSGQKGWKGQDGTDGGNITVVVDPSVTSYNLNTRNNGGKRGEGGLYDGKTGTVQKLNQKVTW